MSCIKRRCCTVVILVSGVFILALGCIFIPVFDKLIHDEIVESVTLKTGSVSYDNWDKNPVPIYFQIWVWDLLNSEEFRNGEKPSLVQRGPYTYRESREKFNITFNPFTVSYREKRWFVFDRQRSIGPDTDTFLTVNPILVTIASFLEGQPEVIHAIAELLFLWANETLFMRRSVSDIMWGYEEPLLQKVKDILDTFNITLNIDDKFGLFVGQNGTDDGVYTIYTGVGDISYYALIDRWNDQKQLTYWTTPDCNDINGTDGTIFPPFVDKSNTLYVFSTDICRSIYLRYTREVSEYGINLWRFETPYEVFANLTISPENIGFCTPAGYENCLPAGLLNIANCKFGAPIVMSQPHFLNADPEMVQPLVVGLHPNPEEHQTTLDVEPYTGNVMNAQKRLQVNIITKNYSYISQTRNMKLTFYPFLWLNESAVVDDDLAEEFKDRLQTPLTVLNVVKYSLIGIGGVMILATLLFLLVVRIRMDKELVDLTRESSPLLQS